MNVPAPDKLNVLVDGEAVAVLPADDRGLQYGDGVFETLAVRDGQPRHWGAHMQRLSEGCRRLGIARPEIGVLAGDCERLCRGVGTGVLKIIVTRGSGGRGYKIDAAAPARRILSLHAWPDYPASHYRQGVKTRLCRTPLAAHPLLAGIKHLNRLENVLARAEWDEEDIAEGLMSDTQGNLVEGTMSNLFMVLEGRLFTPDLHGRGIAGITRARILGAAAELGIEWQLSTWNSAELQYADELFVCNSIIGIWPLRAVDDWQYQVGPVTRRLMHHLGVNE